MARLPTVVIYQTDPDRFVISSGGMWLPGVYATERAARYAFQFTDVELLELNATRSVGGTYQPITTESLRAWRRRRRNPGQ